MLKKLKVKNHTNNTCISYNTHYAANEKHLYILSNGRRKFVYTTFLYLFIIVHYIKVRWISKTMTAIFYSEMFTVFTENNKKLTFAFVYSQMGSSFI